jgi:hypothetical protein
LASESTYSKLSSKFLVVASLPFILPKNSTLNYSNILNIKYSNIISSKKADDLNDEILAE